MKIFAIGDLHLGFLVDKPMDIFGIQWKDHADRIAENWKAVVGPGDLVLIPGDLSWAMRLEEAEQDLLWLDQLPGKKIIIKGNHDYWWSGISRLRTRFKGSSVCPIQYDSVSIERLAVGGTRLWTMPDISSSYRDPLELETSAPEPGSDVRGPGGGEARAQDEKIFTRELEEEHAQG